MADTDKKWGMHLDKIAYGVAGLLGIILILVPVLLGGQINDFSLLAEKDKLVTRWEKETAIAVEPVQVPDLSAEVLKQWEPGAASTLDPRWATERAQVLVRVVPKTKPPNAVHLPPEIQEISCARDTEKKVPYLLVKGIANPANYLVEITKVELFRQEGEGQPALVKGFSAKGDFEYKDYEVTPGKKYTYKCVTHAQRDPKAAANVEFDPAKQATQESAPLGPTDTVPHDWSLMISSIDPPDPGASEPPKFFGRLRYWDYKQGRMVDYKNGQAVYFKENEPIAGLFDFFPVDAAIQTVSVRELTKKGSKAVPVKLKDARQHVPVDLWAKPLTAAPAPEAGKEETPEEDTTAAKAKVTPIKVKPTKEATTKGKVVKGKKSADKTTKGKATTGKTATTKKKDETKSKTTGEEAEKKPSTTKRKFE